MNLTFQFKRKIEILTTLLFLFLFQFTWSQNAGQYVFSQSNGTYTPLSSPTVLTSGSSIDDSAYAISAGSLSGFTFNFGGSNYTAFSVTSNGYVGFGTSSSSSTVVTPLSSTTGGNVFASACAVDLGGIDANTALSWKLEGVAPNRELVFEWKNFKRLSQASVLNFQIRLTETSNTIKVVYGSMTYTSTTSSTAQVGLKSSTTSGHYSNRTTKTNWNSTTAGVANTATCTLSNTVTMPASGLTFTWSIPACFTLPTSLVASNITTTSATTSWTAASPAPAMGYDYELRTSGTAGSGATGLISSGTTAAGVTTQAFSGLTGNTSYSLYVRSKCDASTTSAWTSAYVFLSAKNEPTNQVTNLAAGTVTTTAIPLTWTAAAAGSQLPDGYLIRSSNVDLASIPNPVDGTDLTDVTTFTSGAANKKQTTGTATSTTTFSGMTVGTMYYYKVFSYTNTGTAINYNTTSVPTLSYATLPSVVTTLAFSSTSDTGSTLSWTLPAGYDSAKHQVLVFLKSGSSITAGTPTSLPSTYTASSVFGSGSAYQNDANAKAVYNGDGTSLTITGLSGSTSYYALVYVVMESANSNGLASYSTSSTSNTTTTCASATLPLAQGFNITTIPSCWTQQTVVGTTALTFPVSASNPVIGPQEGSDFVMWNSFNASSGNQTRLVSPPINSNGLLGAGLRFYWFHDNSSYTTSQYIGEGVKVQYSTNGTTWTDVQAIDRLLTGTNGWTLYDINLPVGVVNQNNLYIGFLFTSKLGNNCALDNVTVYAATGCLVPSNLSSSSVTENSANVTFTAPLSVPSNGYDVYYSTTNVAPASNATPNVDNATSTTVALTGLNANTVYYWWVRSDCSSDISSWVSGGSFTTSKIEPSNQVTNLAAGTVTTTAIPLTWTAAVAGSQLPDGYLIRSSNVDLASIPNPVDGTDLTDVTTFTSGAANKKQTTGTATSTTTFSGMTAGTMYYYKAFSYTNTGAAINYNTTSVPTLSYATLPSSTNALSFSATTTNSSTLSWSLPAGYDATKHQVLVFLKSGSSITTGTPTSLPSTYTASSVFGSGSVYQNDANAKAVYNGDSTSVDISGLNSSTTYYILVYVVMESANSNGTASYSTSTTSNVTTSCAAIVSFPSTELFSSYLPTCWTEGDGGDLTTGPATTVAVNDATSLWSPEDYLNSGSSNLGSAKVNIYSNVMNDWLISPAYNLASGYRLKYGVGATEYNATTTLLNAWESDDYVQLLVNEIGTSTWNVLKLYNNTNVPSYLGQTDIVDLSSYSNKTVRFAFRVVEGTSNGSADIDFFIDNFSVELIPADIVITPSGSTTICSGTSVNLVASSTEGYTYTWSPSTGLSATTGASVTASPTVTTTYTVTGVNGAINTTKTVTITVNPNADTITVPSSYTTCSDSPIALVASLPPTSLVIGSGTTAGTSTNTPYRFNISAANSSRVQYLITKSELNAMGLNAAGYIRSLGFNVVTLGGTTASSYEIKMANVTNTSLTSTYLTPTFTTVFSNSVTLTTGLNTHTFSTPFYWDGTSNIVINICHNSPNTGNTIVAVSTPAQTSTISGSGTTQCTTTTGTTNTSRPVMTLGINNNLRTVTWSPSTDLYLDNLATQSYAGESSTTVYYKGSSNATYTVTNTSGSCSNQASTLVNVIAQPIAEITGNATICNGSSTDLLFTGTANATITYSNGIATNTVTLNNAGTATVTVSPIATTTYTLVSVSTGTVPVCTASLTESITVTVQALPSASVTAASGVICQGSSAIFNIIGTNGSVVSYTINGGSVASTTLVDGVSEIVLNDVSTTQVIQLVSVSYANCIQNLSGQATVEMGTVASLVTISDVYVDATTKKYVVTAIPNVQTYEWTLPSSVGLISSNTLGNEILVSIPTNYVAGDGILSVKAIGTCGTSNVITRTITPITPTITGLSVICPDTTTSVTYQAPIISGASYNWVLPAGMSLSSGAGTSSITVGVNSTFQSGYVSLTISTSERTYTNRLIVGRVGSPAVINGPVSLCATTTATYSVDPIADAQSYVWEVPAGISIVSGSGSNSISVTVSPTYVTGTIKVFAVGPCGSGLARSLVVSKSPGAINLNGPKSICGQSTASHSITSGVVNTTLNSVFIYATSALNGVSSFLWTVPTGATIVQGQGTSMIYVSYSNDFISGPVSVVPQVSCGLATAKSITVSNSVVTISGPSDLCGVTEATYSVPSTAGSNFVWTLPAGMHFVSGNGTSTIKVLVSATCASSTISVTYQSSCSNNGLTATKTVGCAVQSALYPSFCGTTLLSMGSTLIANEVVGATKYKFTVQNGTTSYSYESLTRFFKLTDLNVALLYATPYSINVSVMVNGLWYNSACNSCVITTPSVGNTKLISSQCNSNLSSFTSTISADIVSNATEYMFEVVGPEVSVTYTSNLRWFRLSQITSVQFAYGTVYSIRVKAKVGGQWGSYGETCTVTTPSIPTTNVISNQCGITLNSISTAVVANLISGVTSYKFEIVSSSFTTEYTTNQRWFKFSDLTGVTILYGTPYTIRVKVQINGQWGVYSSSCVVTTPSIPTTQVMHSQCGHVLSKLNGSISANVVPSVSQYMFEITSGSSVFEYSTANRWFRLTDVVGLSVFNNTTYGVRVRVMLNGQWGSYGESCNVTTPIATTITKNVLEKEDVKPETEVSIVLYPNPFVEYFSIGLEGYKFNEEFSVSLFDINGKQIYSNRMMVSELQVIQLGKNLPSGMYLLRLESSSIDKTYKLVKK